MALVTCSQLPELDPDNRLLIEPLMAAGVAADVMVWDDPAADWTVPDLIVLRSPWDYARRRDEFVAWAAQVPRLANPADVVVWNTDKRYLADLDAAGVPVVATSWVGTSQRWHPPESGEWVIKPAISAGSKDSGRYDVDQPAHRELAAAHVTRLQAAGRLVMVQPYLPGVDSHGETSLLFFHGEYSHAIRKGPMLHGPDVGGDGLYEREEITPREPTPAEHAVAAKALGAIPGGAERLLYARVDLIPAGAVAGRDGEPVVGELELTEPSLFLGAAVGAPDRFASAILRALAPFS